MADPIDEFVQLLLALPPHDQEILCNLVLGFDRLDRTGERTPLAEALAAFWARVEEKDRIAKH
jgi:hypothetical protein